MSRQFLISATPLETRAALLEDGKLVEFYHERAEIASIVGNIYLGKVKDVVPGMEAAFIDIGLERSAFLYVKELVGDYSGGGRIEDRLKSGQRILVQVTRRPVGTKGARVTAEITLAGRQLVYLPFSEKAAVSRRLPDKLREKWRDLLDNFKLREGGVIVRTAATKPDLTSLKRELGSLRRLWRRIQRNAGRAQPPCLIHEEPALPVRVARDFLDDGVDKLITDSKEQHQAIIKYLQRLAPEFKSKVELYRKPKPLFKHFRVQKQLEHALDRRVWLKSGGYITIDVTEALTAIDVNTGRYVGKSKLSVTILKTNMEAAVEVARQLRLRDIGGIIVTDFIDMDSLEDQKKVIGAMHEALAKDRSKLRLGEISSLGLVEMTRKRISGGIYSLYEICPRCRGEGRVLSLETAVSEAFREITEMVVKGSSGAYLFKVSPEIHDYFKQRQHYMKQIRRQYRKCALLAPDGSFKDGAVKLVAEGTVRQMNNRWKQLIVV